MAFDHDLHQVTHRTLIRDVDAHRLFIARAGIEVGDHDIGATCRQRVDDAAPDASRTAGDDGHTPVEITRAHGFADGALNAHRPVSPLAGSSSI